ncbi:MAG: helix-hairpin-helix domain-containing protein [Hyphomicrobiales bacterium]|nr:helix-hairpin-helix domain-containing protein [Hyphomicrobiales bacterium]
MPNASANKPAGNHQAHHVIEANLREMADLLEQQDADRFRIQAYRNAADALSTLQRPLADILAGEGTKGLIALPAIGSSIAAAIAEMLQTGRWAQLERLRGTTSPEDLFCTVPGIGPKLAARLHDDLHLDTLEALEVAAHDGRLNNLAGFGGRRVSMIKASLQERLGRRRLRSRHVTLQPPVDMLLDVDREYRQRTAKNELRRIAPRRFNPDGLAWLSVLHTRRADWIFTAMFSNTQTAHQLGRTHDWVVIYFHTDSHPEAQCTVVTETIGAQRGYRVVRGREPECAAFYDHRGAAA